jgi:hypothetical protein
MQNTTLIRARNLPTARTAAHGRDRPATNGGLPCITMYPTLSAFTRQGPYIISRSAAAAEVWAEGDEGEDFEQHLRADHRGVGCGVVLRGDLDDVAADDVEALEAVQDRLGLARG